VTHIAIVPFIAIVCTKLHENNRGGQGCAPFDSDILRYDADGLDMPDEAAVRARLENQYNTLRDLRVRATRQDGAFRQQITQIIWDTGLRVSSKNVLSHARRL